MKIRSLGHSWVATVESVEPPLVVSFDASDAGAKNSISVFNRLPSQTRARDIDQAVHYQPIGNKKSTGGGKENDA